MMVTAQRANIEEKMFLRWVVSYQTQMTFEDFKKKTHISSEHINDDRNEEQILEAVKNILGRV